MECLFKKIGFFSLFNKIVMIPVYLFLSFHLILLCIFLYQDPQNEDLKTDAIVVFTGGDKRVFTAVELFQKDMAPLLYISGLHPETTVKQTLKTIGMSFIDSSNIFFDHAKNTDENAKFTSEWVKKNNIKSLRLVTTRLHMKRSLLLLTKELPDVLIIPHIVEKQPSKDGNIVIQSYPFVEEFLKYEYEILSTIKKTLSR